MKTREWWTVSRSEASAVRKNEVVIFRVEGGEKYGMVVESSKERVEVKWVGSSRNYTEKGMPQYRKEGKKRNVFNLLLLRLSRYTSIFI